MHQATSNYSQNHLMCEYNIHNIPHQGLKATVSTSACYHGPFVLYTNARRNTLRPFETRPKLWQTTGGTRHPKNNFFCFGSSDAEGRRTELGGRPPFLLFLLPAAATAPAEPAVLGLLVSGTPGAQLWRLAEE